MSRKHPKPIPPLAYETARYVRAIDQAKKDLRRQVCNLIDRSDRAELESWARSLTETNCDWSHYELAQEVLAGLATLARRAPAGRAGEGGGEG